MRAQQGDRSQGFVRRQVAGNSGSPRANTSVRLVLEALRDALMPLSARAVMQLVAARKAVPEHLEFR
jgi:hypothetical protein